MNWPMMPVQKRSGAKAATVVAVDAATAPATSLVPSIAAVIRSAPSSMCRKTFSTMTIALSTNIPSAMISAKSTIMFRVIPKASMKRNASSIESGMARATKNEFRTPMKKSSTPTTRSRPVMIPFSSSLTMSLTNLDWSPSTSKATPAGQSSICSAASAFTAVATSRMFAPARLETATDTAVRPFIRA